MLRRGFLQRDVSIGNVLQLDPPVTMTPFGAGSLEGFMAGHTLQDNDLVTQAKLLETLIGRKTECHGFIIDGDMAARLEGYFTLHDTGERSVSALNCVWRNPTKTSSMQGTYEFMSVGLVDTLWSSSTYLHSPVDDLESFYYTAQWAVAFNDGLRGERHDGKEIQSFREAIAGSRQGDATLKIQTHLTYTRKVVAEYGAFFAHSLALLAPWFIKVSALSKEWTKVMDQAEDFDGEEREKYLSRKFLAFSYRGVREYFELVREHSASLQMVV
jgi:hypothetical protein